MSDNKNKTITSHEDQALWDLLGEDQSPDWGSTVWPAVRARSTGSEQTGWLPRLAYGSVGLTCAAVGLWIGLSFDGAVNESEWLVTDTMVEGSLLDETDWSLSGLYMAWDANTDEGLQ